MFLVRRALRSLGRAAIVAFVLLAAALTFWASAPTPLKQTIVFDALAQTGCVPNPNLQGPPNMVNSCPIMASAFNNVLGSTFTFFVVQAYGAKGDGSTNDTPAVNAALAACSTAGGGFVYFPPTGHSYSLASAPNAIPSGCQLHGMGEQRWPSAFPFDNTEADWTASGSWLKCLDTVNPCIHFTGVGSSIERLNFWYNQPTPPHGTACSLPCTFTNGWTPTNYPFTILVDTTSNSTRLSRLSILNATNCIDFEGPASGVSGVWTSEEHLALGCAKTGQKFRFIDNVISFNDVHHEMWWYQGSSDQWAYMEGPNHIDWDVCYLSNPMVNNVEFAFSALAMKFTDCTVTSGFGNITFAMQVGQLNNVSFNEVCQAMAVASSTAHVTFTATNTIAYTDSSTSPVAGQCANQTGATTPANFIFQLNSDNVIASFEGLSAGFVQGLATIGGGGGGGAHGQLHINQAVVLAYSQYQASTPAILTDATGSIAYVADAPTNFFPSGSFTAGVRCSGAGCVGPVSFLGGILIEGAAGTSRSLVFGTGKAPPTLGASGCPRFGMRVDNVAEGGSNAGSNFNIDTYADNCAPLATPMVINRATGQLNMNSQFFPQQLTVGTLPSCNGTIKGALVIVTDQNGTPTYGGSLTGGGSTAWPAYCNGSAWAAH